MKRDFLPLFATSTVVFDKTITFYKAKEKVIVEAPAKLIKQLTRICNGIHSRDEIVGLLKAEWNEILIRGLIRDLKKWGILIDSRSFANKAWESVKNPSHFPLEISNEEIKKLVEEARARHKKHGDNKTYQVSPDLFNSPLGRRSSTRYFSEEEISFQDMIDMLWSAYGETERHNRTVPSAGALYPLLIHLALFRKTGEFMPGIYSVLMTSPGAISLKLVSRNTKKFMRAFLDPLMLEKSHGSIVVSGSFNITEKKYGNRSMLYVPLEVGHVAQNVHLTATLYNVGTVEIGGFVEELLTDSLKLSRQYHPLTTIVFGREGKKINPENIETDWVVPFSGNYKPPFTIALARVSEKLNEDWSYGRSSQPSLAFVKATAEAREWAAGGCVSRKLIQSQFRGLEKAIDPRLIIRFHPSQYKLKHFPFAPFDEEKKYEWVEGKNELTGASTYILADLVYFPYHSLNIPYAYANSSGVAAHPDRQKALEASTLELIERDSFMIAYLAKPISPTVSQNTLSGDIQKRIRALKSVGFQIWIKDHSLDLAPVIFVFAQNADLTYSTCASCSSFDREYAVSHALMEVEASALARLQNGPAKSRSPREIKMPLDHGAIYEQKKYFRHADSLFRGNKIIHFKKIGMEVAQSWNELIDILMVKNFNLLTIPLFLSEKYGGNNGLHIIRSFIPGIVPMTFGYREEPGGMERIYSVAKHLGNKTLSYKDLVKFPHPFA